MVTFALELCGRPESAPGIAAYARLPPHWGPRPPSTTTTTFFSPALRPATSVASIDSPPSACGGAHPPQSASLASACRGRAGTLAIAYIFRPHPPRDKLGLHLANRADSIATERPGPAVFGSAPAAISLSTAAWWSGCSMAATHSAEAPSDLRASTSAPSAHIISTASKSPFAHATISRVEPSALAGASRLAPSLSASAAAPSLWPLVPPAPHVNASSSRRWMLPVEFSYPMDCSFLPSILALRSTLATGALCWVRSSVYRFGHSKKLHSSPHLDSIRPSTFDIDHLIAEKSKSR